MERDKLTQKQLEKLMHKEKKLLKRSNIISSNSKKLTKALEEKIPVKAVETCQKAFEKGFQIVFSSGTEWIEKSCSPEKLKNEYEINQFALKRDFSNKNLKRFDKQAGKQVWQSKGLATLEGGVLGLLGIGLPDIPVFIGVLVRTIYQAAISYGFDCQQAGERFFVLSIIDTAISEGEERQRLSARTDYIGWQLDRGTPICTDLEEAARETSNRLAANLLTAKFIQGLPIVGVVGAAINYNLVDKVSRVAVMKYKKRFLGRMENKHRI